MPQHTITCQAMNLKQSEIRHLPLQFFLLNTFNVPVKSFKLLVSIGLSPWSTPRFFLGLIFMSPYLWYLDGLILN